VDSSPHVRHSAVFVLPGLLGRIPLPKRRAFALTQIRKFQGDSASNVRSAVFDILGEIIYAFSGDKDGPPKELVDLFMGVSPTANRRTQTVLPTHSRQPSPPAEQYVVQIHSPSQVRLIRISY
jgi:serine/threonine-protein phosphatase 4 regulatory subunit 1